MIAQLASIVSLLAYVSAGPVPAKRTFGSFGGGFGFDGFGSFDSSSHSSFSSSSSSHFDSSVSFDNWGGFSSFGNFDNFYGVNNFCGFIDQSTLVVEQQQELVCHSVSVEIIQQQLAVIREYVKKIITTQICEVETQTVVFSQFQSSIFGFGEDIRHVSGRHIGFDSSIADQIVNIHDESGSIVSSDLGFQGSDIGSHFVSPSGFNWNDASSPSSVSSAYGASVSAAAAGNGGSSPLPPPPSSSSASVPPPPAASADASAGTDSSNSTDTSTDASVAASAAAPASTDASSGANPNPADD